MKILITLFALKETLNLNFWVGLQTGFQSLELGRVYNFASSWCVSWWVPNIQSLSELSFSSCIWREGAEVIYTNITLSLEQGFSNLAASENHLGSFQKSWCSGHTQTN